MKDEVKENIINLAIKNASHVKKISNNLFYETQSLDDENIYIKFNLNKTIEYTPNNYLRRDIFINIINNQIAPILNLNKEICLNFNFHDFYDKPGTLVFGASKNTKAILIPDIYQIYNYQDYSKTRDPIPFNQKISKIIFGGASTGSINLKNNQRVNTCIWSVKNEWAFKNTYFKLTNIVQTSINELNTYTTENNVNIKNIIGNNLSIEDQLNNRYILSIDGNTWAWDRPVWIMRSNSLFFKYESNNVGWYYDFLKENEHYVSVNINNMENKFNFFENNHNQALNIIRNANEFVKDYCSEEAWKFYLKTLLENISYLD
jgi:hypothetical protein